MRSAKSRRQEEGPTKRSPERKGQEGTGTNEEKRRGERVGRAKAKKVMPRVRSKNKRGFSEEKSPSVERINRKTDFFYGDTRR